MIKRNLSKHHLFTVHEKSHKALTERQEEKLFLDLWIFLQNCCNTKNLPDGDRNETCQFFIY